MVYWIVIVVLILGILAYLLLAPLVLFIDTASNKYLVRYGTLVKGYFESDPKEFIRLRIKVLFLNFNTYPLKWKKNKVKRDKTKHGKRKSRLNYKKFIKLIRSFRVRRFYLQMDTGDYVQNAKLIPMTVAAQAVGVNMSVNFQNQNRLVLELRNRAIDILKSFY